MRRPLFLALAISLTIGLVTALLTTGLVRAQPPVPVAPQHVVGANCTGCHAVGVGEPLEMPANHQGRTNDLCLGCHTLAQATPTPTASPTAAPTASPTAAPTASPTAAPTASPTASPTGTPRATATPTAAPTVAPTATPAATPAATATPAPTAAPTATPVLTAAPGAASPALPPAGGGTHAGDSSWTPWLGIGLAGILMLSGLALARRLRRGS